MAYTLQAVIAKEGVMRIDQLDALRIVRLGSGIEMIPLGSEVRKRLRLDFLPLTDEGESALPIGLADLCSELSGGGRVAYVEAEFFGGIGTQASAIFENGNARIPPVVGEDAINQALREIGVVAAKGKDEFDCAGLGKHRDTEGWLE
jgi:hypothetical protein